MKLLTNPTAVDQLAITTMGVLGRELMESAARSVAEAVMKTLSQADNPNVVVLCGPGNNGADGLACARFLAEAGISTLTVLLTQPLEAYKGEDAKIQASLLAKTAVSIQCLQSVEEAEIVLLQAGVFVDALFGSGFGSDLSRPLEGLSLELIRRLNQRSASQTLIAVDVPSGLSIATGQPLPEAVYADCTITFATGKPGLYLVPGKFHVGELTVVDIGMPPAAIDAALDTTWLISPEVVKPHLPRRKPEGHKYENGHLLLVAGSKTMPGAAVLAAKAAMRAGCGVVTLAAPESVFVQTQFPPEILRLPLPESAGVLTLAAATVLAGCLEGLQRFSAIAMGPGLSQTPDTTAFFSHLLPVILKSGLPAVLDADALNLLATSFQALSSNVVITPHLGEAARLLGEPKEVLAKDLLAAATRLQTRYHAQVVLKSASTVVATTENKRSGKQWINPTGHPMLATAGSGDVLTGIAGSFLAQGVLPCWAAVMSPYIHGFAGETVSKTLGETGGVASDIIEALPSSLTACYTA